MKDDFLDKKISEALAKQNKQKTEKLWKRAAWIVPSIIAALGVYVAYLNYLNC